MRKQELENWVENGGDLPDDLTVDEKSYLKGLGWSVEEEWHKKGQKELEGHYLHGKEHGVQKMWYKNGQKYCEENYHHGKKHGTQKRWWYDGILEAHKEYAYGVFLKDFLK